MRTIVLGLAAMAVVSFSLPATAASVSEREYKRGFNDCMRGEYDQNQHGASYKRGCSAAEGKGGSTGEAVKGRASSDHMRAACRGAVLGRFHRFTRTVQINDSSHGASGWTLYGQAVLDDGSTSQIACLFSSSGVLRQLNASDPQGGVSEMDHEGYCPPDVSEANRYQYPGCN